MSNLIPKNKFVILVVIIALLSIVLYCVGLLVVLGEKKEIEELYLNTESESAKEEKISVIKNIAETNKDLIQTLQNYFVQKDDEVKFIEQIEKIARASGVKFEMTSIDVKANQPNSFSENVNVKMKLEGFWRGVVSFIDKLEKMPFGVLVEKIDLDANVPGDWSGTIEFIIFREK